MVGMQFGGRKHMAAEGISQGAMQRSGGADPASEQGTFEVHTFACVYRALALWRNVVGEFGHQNVRQEVRGGQATLNRSAIAGATPVP